MATRSRTLLFLNFRNSFVRSSNKRGGGGAKYIDPDNENAGLIANGGGGEDEVVVEMNILPPKWCVRLSLILTFLIFRVDAVEDVFYHLYEF